MAPSLAVFTLAIAIGLLSVQAAILDNIFDFGIETSARQDAAPASIAKCTADADCNLVDRDALSLKCIAGSCAPSKLGADCASSLSCSTFTWCGPGAKCARGAPGADCTTWRQCDLGNACVAGKCSAGTLGTKCDTTYNCAEGSTCVYSKCVPGIRAAPCRTDFDCKGKCTLNIIGNFVTGFCTAPPPPSPKPSPSASPAPKPVVPVPAVPKPAVPVPAVPKPVVPKPVVPKPVVAKPVVSKPDTQRPAAATAPPAPVTPTTPTVPTPAAPVVATAETPGTSGAEPVSAPGSTVVAPEATPDAAAGGTVTDPTETTVPGIGEGTSPNQQVCIGASSHVAGTKFADALHPSMRLQVHPLRMFQRDSAIDMLCHEAAGSRLCASATHVLAVDGKHVYMSEFCADKICTSVKDYPLNFKGACGMHLEFMKGVHATQHAGIDYSLTADAVARQECAARDSNRAAWFLSTL